MQDGFQEIPLPGIFTIEEFQQLKHEFLIDDFLPNARLEVGGLKETQEKLIDKLKVAYGNGLND